MAILVLVDRRARHRTNCAADPTKVQALHTRDKMAMQAKAQERLCLDPRAAALNAVAAPRSGGYERRLMRTCRSLKKHQGASGVGLVFGIRIAVPLALASLYSARRGDFGSTFIWRVMDGSAEGAR